MVIKLKVNSESEKCSTENMIKIFRTSTVILILKLEKKNRREEGREYGRKEVLERVTKTFQDLGDRQTKSRETLSPAFSLNGALALVITL